MSTAITVRPAVSADAEALLRIYRPFVEETAISFEARLPTLSELEQRIVRALDAWAWLVAEVEGRPVGYAYGSAHRPREAYRYAVETSAYVESGFQRQGIASALYRQLLTDLATRGYHNAYAGVTLPNNASLGFHRHLGFEDIGVFPRVGYKFGQWHDVAWLYRPLVQASRQPDV